MNWWRAAVVVLASLLAAERCRGSAPAAAVRAALDDARRLPPDRAKFARYLYVGHLPEKDRKTLTLVLSGWVNFLSRARRVVPPAALLAGGGEESPLRLRNEDWPKVVALRLNALDYRLNLDVWEKLQPPDFVTEAVAEEAAAVGARTTRREYGNYFDRATGKAVATTHEAARGRTDVVWRTTEVREEAAAPGEAVRVLKVVEALTPAVPPGEWAALAALTHSRVPVVYGDWWLWQTSIENERDGTGYYSWLGIKDQTTYHNLVGFDRKVYEEKFKDFTQEWRAAVAVSGVVKQPRRIARFEKLGGGLWITFDNQIARNRVKGGKVDFRNPLSVLGDELKFDGTEQFGHLPNGLWAVFAGDADGKALASAPDFLGYDRHALGATARIECAMSCIVCHTEGGVQSFRSYHQRLHRAPKPGEPGVPFVTPDAKKLQEVSEQYFAALEEPIALDRARYAAALRQACGMEPRAFAQALGERFGAYDAPVTLSRAAAAVGSTPDEMVWAISAYLSQKGGGDLILAAWSRPGDDETFVIDTWHEILPLTQGVVVAWRAVKAAGMKPINAETPECRAFMKERGYWPCVEKGGTLYGWNEAAREAGVKWPPAGR